MKSSFIIGFAVGLFLIMVLASGYVVGQGPTPKFVVLGNIKLKANVKAQDFESKFGKDTLEALEAEYKGAKGLIAVYRLKASDVGAKSKLRVKKNDYAYLQLWDSAQNIESFWNPDGKAEGRGKFKEVRPEIMKLGKVDFSCFEVEPVIVSKGNPKFVVLGSIKLKANVKAQDFESKFGKDTLEALEAEYKGAKGLIAVYRLKASDVGAKSKLRAKETDYAYLQLWDSAENIEKFWDPDGKAEGRGKFKEVRPEIMKLGKVDFGCFELAPVVIR